MRKLNIGAVLIASLAALAAPAEAQTPATTSVKCDPVTHAADAWKNPATRYIVFGEVHGTSEAPKVFGDMICAALQAGKKVAVGLEMPQFDQKLYQDYVASNGTGPDREKLLQASYWQPPYQDGRTSQSMFALIEKLRLLRAQGLNIAIFTFQPYTIHDPGADETEMAKHVTDAGKLYGDRLVFTLMGNVHASKTKEGPYGQPMAYAPMAAHLPADTTLSVLVGSRTGGSSWNCRSAPDGTHDCGAHGSSAPPSAQKASAPDLTLLDKAQFGHDAELTVDRYTASPPMVAAP